MSIIIKGGSNSQLANVDTLGNLQVLSTPAAISSVAAPWTSATVDNTAQVLFNTGGWSATIVQLNQTSTITGGAVTFEGTYDGVNWESLPATFVLDPQLYTQIVNPYVLTANTNQAVLLVAGGFQQLRVRLDPVILGTGQVTIYWTLLASSPIRNSNSFSLTGSIPAGSNTIGAVTQDATAGPWVQNLTQVGGTAIGLGSDTSANSFPVVIASDQAAIPVSQSGAPWSQNLTYVGGSAISLGSAVSADSIPVVIASDQGAVTVAQSNAANLKATVSQAGSWAVSVSNFPATQPVSSTQLPATLDGDGNLMVAVQGTVPVSGTFWQSVQPVSGTVTANISGSISNTAFGVTGDVAIVNSTTPGSTKIAVTADPITFAAPQHTIVDSGTITANQGGTWNIGTVTNPVTVTQGTAANLNATVVGTGTFAVQAAQTGTWNVRVQDGSGNALTSTTGALDVNLKTSVATVTVAQATAANLNATVVGTVTANAGTGTFTTSDVNAVAQGSTTSGENGFLEMGAVTTAAPTYVTTQTAPLSLDTSGNLRTSVNNTVAVSGTVAATQSGTWNIGSVTSITNAVTVSQGTAANLNATVVGTGTFAVQASQSGTWNVRTQDGSGNALTSTTGALDVNLKTSAATVTVTGIVAATQSGTWNIGTLATVTNPVTVSQGTAANLNATVVGTGTFAVQAAQSGAWTVTANAGTGTFTVTELLPQVAGYYPDQSNSYSVGTITPSVDAGGSLITRGAVFVDEGSFREEFTGSSLDTLLTGTVTFTNGSTNVTGVGTAFTTEVPKYAFVKKSADSETLYVAVNSIQMTPN